MKYWFYGFSKFILWVFFRFGFGLTVRGRAYVPRRGGFILASNHLSYLDPPVLGAACPRRLAFMARSNLFESPLLGAFMRGVHVIPLQRDEGDVAAMREAVRRLRRGEAVAIFPEGGRQFSGQLGVAKRGVGLLAAKAQVPVVPVVVRGTFEALSPHTTRLRRAKIQVAFGEAISYTMPSHEHHQALAAAVTRQWHHLLEQLHG